MSEEIWKDVVGYEGIYQVSSLGWVMRIAGGPGAQAGRILKPRRAGRGYLQVDLYRSGENGKHYVHRLVAEAFLGPAPSPDHEVNHKNGDKADNWVENLEWVTHAENMSHADIVLDSRVRGEEHCHAKLTEADVVKIRKLHATGKHTQAELAERFGVSPSLVSGIVHYKRWAHVGGPIAPHVDGPLCGEANAAAKLREDDVRRIRKLYATGKHTQAELAETFGISPANVSLIVRCEAWKHVPQEGR